jgi:hypothetical protein
MESFGPLVRTSRRSSVFSITDEMLGGLTEHSRGGRRKGGAGLNSLQSGERPLYPTGRRLGDAKLQGATHQQRFYVTKNCCMICM